MDTASTVVLDAPFDGNFTPSLLSLTGLAVLVFTVAYIYELVPKQRANYAFPTSFSSGI
jgi:hypothetical protein